MHSEKMTWEYRPESSIADGGDGGRGGDLIFEVDPGINTLNEFRHIRKYCAEDGEPGGKRRCHGKDGADLVVKVPAGTIVKEANSGQVITDMSYDNTREVILKGGRGGKGNRCRCQNMLSRENRRRNWK